jgi:anti-sigma factor RsiW
MEQADGQLSQAELAAFADGSLPPSRHAQVAARIRRSSKLRALVAEQQAVLHAFRALDAPAPVRLRVRIRPEPSRRPSRLRPLPPAIAAATAVLLVVLLSPQSRRKKPAVLEVAAWDGSMDIARVYGGMLPPVAPDIHRRAP